MAAFQARLCSTPVRAWQCSRCGGWHYEAKPHSPSGQTSGGERVSKLPPGFVPFVRASRARRPAQQDLPQARRAPAEAEPSRLDLAPRPALKSQRERELF